MNTIDIIYIVVGLALLIAAIIGAGVALERRMARKLAASLLGKACPFCSNPFRKDTIRSARLEYGFEDDDISVVCAKCSRKFTQYEKDRAA